MKVLNFKIMLHIDRHFHLLSNTLNFIRNFNRRNDICLDLVQLVVYYIKNIPLVITNMNN